MTCGFEAELRPARQCAGHCIATLALMAAPVLVLADERQPLVNQQADSRVHVEEIVITAGRTGDPLNDFGGSVIDQAAVEILQPVSALDLLDRIPGVRAFEKAGGVSYLSIRGGEPNFTLVFLDGVRVNDPTNSRGGAFDFGQIDPLALDQIEVAKGALSAVHGADALSGAVNLRLRTLGENEQLMAVRTTADTDGGAGGSATLGAGWQGGDVLVGGSASDYDDTSAGSDLERSQLFGRAHQNVAGLRLSALALRANSERRAFPEDSGGPRLAVIRDREHRDTGLTLTSLSVARADTGADWRPKLSLDWMRQRDDASTPPIAPGPTIDGVPAITADSRFERREFTFDNRLFAGRQAEFAFGTSYLKESGEATGSIDVGSPLPADFEIEREVIGGFAEASFRPAEWVLATLGVRYDDPSPDDHEWTGRAALRLEPTADAPAVFVSWSEGFKLPSLFALAYPIIANPELKPERSENYEIGVEQLWPEGRGRARLSYFHSRYTDLIDFDPELFTNVNRSQVTARGVEAELAAQISSGLGLSANATYLETEQPTEVLPLRSRPKWQGLVSLDWSPDEQLDLLLSAAYTSDFFDSSVPTGFVTLEGRTDVTAAGTYRLNDNFSFTLTLRNLFAQDYEDAVGFPAPGRVARASVALQL